MITENGKIEGDHVVTGHLTLNGMVTGTLTVASGGSVRLNGVCGRLVVQSDASAEVGGMVVADVLNEGTMHLSGVVNGSVLTKHGRFTRTERSIVRGEVK